MPSSVPPVCRGGASTVQAAWTRGLLPLCLAAVLGAQQDAEPTAAFPARPGTAAWTSREAGPLAFVENGGQWPMEVRFHASRGPAASWFTDRGWVVALRGRAPASERAPVGQGCGIGADGELRGVAVRMTFVGGASVPVATGRLPGRRNYYTEHGAAEDVAAFTSLRYAGMYPGVDLTIRDDGSFFAYDLAVAPGAALERIVLRFEGAEGLGIDSSGQLVVRTAVGEIRQTAPVAWHELPDGARSHVPCCFRLLDREHVGFSVDGGGRELPLVIDPGIRYATYLGGAVDEWIYDAEVDALGRVTVAGETLSTNFPTTVGPYVAGRDVFAARIDPSQAGAAGLLWSTLLGGTADDVAFAMTVTPDGVTTAIGGYTQSAGFPITPNALPIPSPIPPLASGFVVQLGPTGGLTYSSFLGGTANDWVCDMELDAAGVLTIAGYTDSIGFPTTSNAWLPTSAGGYDAFVLRMDPTQTGSAQLLWSTYLGGSGTDGIAFPPPTGSVPDLSLLDVALDGSRVFVVGRTDSVNFPTTPGCYQPTFAGPPNADIFMSLLDPSLAPSAQLVYSTYLGGQGDDGPFVVETHPERGVVIGGFTWSGSFPTTGGAYGTTFSGVQNDGVLAWLDPAGSGLQDLVYSTYWAGNVGVDWVSAIDLESSGIVTFGGRSDGPTQGTPGSHQPTPPGGYVARLFPRGNGRGDLHYLSYGTSLPLHLQLDETAEVTVAGIVRAGFITPTANAYQPTHAGGLTDGSIVQLDLLPNGVARTGPTTPACTGPIYFGVNSWPRAGNNAFTLFGTNAPPNTLGALVLGPPMAPAPMFGVTALLVPAIAVTVTTDGLGLAELPLPLPAGLAPGSTLHLQWAFVNTASCSNGGLFSASHRLDLTIQ